MHTNQQILRPRVRHSRAGGNPVNILTRTRLLSRALSQALSQALSPALSRSHVPKHSEGTSRELARELVKNLTSFRGKHVLTKNEKPESINTPSFRRMPESTTTLSFRRMPESTTTLSSRILSRSVARDLVRDLISFQAKHSPTKDGCRNQQILRHSRAGGNPVNKKQEHIGLQQWQFQLKLSSRPKSCHLDQRERSFERTPHIQL